MPPRGHAEARDTYLVEHYRPGLQVEELRHLAARVRDAMREPVRFVRSTIVPGDESVLCLLEAPSEQLVREAYARAGITFERISAAIDQGGRT